MHRPSENSGWIHRLLAAAIVGWWGFVSVAYLFVDESGLFAVSGLVTGRAVAAALGVVVAVAAVGVAVGIATRSLRTGLALLAALTAAVALVAAVPSPLASFLELPDGARAVAVVIAFTLGGAGIRIGTRLVDATLSPATVAAFAGLPLVAVTVVSGSLVVMLGALWLLVTAWVIGTSVVDGLALRTPGEDAEPGRDLVIEAACGLALLALVMLALATAGYAGRTHLAVIWTLSTPVVVWRLIRVGVRLAPRSWTRPLGWSLPEAMAAGMYAGLLVVFLIGALAPETGSDALNNRVAIPASVARTGALEPRLELIQTYSTLAGEMLVAALSPFASTQALRVLQFWLACILMISCPTPRLSTGARVPAWPFLLPFWASTVVWWQFFNGFVDLMQLWFVCIAIMALQRWTMAPLRPGWAAMAGLLCGTAAGIKLNTTVVVLVLAAAIMGFGVARKVPRRCVTNAVIWLVVGAGLTLGPWLFRSWLLTGNPVFPWANLLFGSPLGLPVAAAITYGLPIDLQAWRIPWKMVFAPQGFVELGSYHPLLIGLLASGMVLFRWWRRDAWLWLLAGGGYGAFWMATDQNLRYGFVAAYCLSVFVARAFVAWLTPSSTRTQVIAWVLLVGSLAGFAVSAVRPTFWARGSLSGPAFPAGVLLGTESERSYLSTHTLTYACAVRLNERVGDHARVWLLPPLRDHLYFDAVTISEFHGTEPVLRPLRALLEQTDGATIVEGLESLGVTHIGVHQTLNPSLQLAAAGRPMVLSAAFARRHLVLECEDRGFKLYRVQEVDASAEPEQPASSAVAPEIAGDVFVAPFPNPVTVCDGSGLGITTISWRAPGESAIEIRVRAPDGPLLASAGPVGSVSTGKWVSDGMAFHLVGPRGLLASTVVNVSSQGCPTR